MKSCLNSLRKETRNISSYSMNDLHSMALHRNVSKTVAYVLWLNMNLSVRHNSIYSILLISGEHYLLFVMFTNYVDPKTHSIVTLHFLYRIYYMLQYVEPFLSYNASKLMFSDSCSKTMTVALRMATSFFCIRWKIVNFIRHNISQLKLLLDVWWHSL